VPNHEDYEALYADFKVLIQRALVEHIPALKDYHDLVEFHIPHPYSKESSKKSNVVSIKYTCVALLIEGSLHGLAQKLHYVQIRCLLVEVWHLWYCQLHGAVQQWSV
jgi:hypothetical protein